MERARGTRSARRNSAAPEVDVAAIVATICESAALPLERARTLPPEAYRARAFYELEVERIFRREWMCVARVEEVAQPGDTLCVDLVGEPIVLTRDESGRLRALSRVCRHRAIDLMSGKPPRCSGATRLTCPYHLWTYRLDGTLIGAPEMQRAAGFERADYALAEFGVETWQGFVFVNLDRAAPPLAPRLVEIEKLIEPVDLAGWQTAGTVPWGEVEANWKVVIENAAECYHHMGTHAETLQPLWPGSTVRPQGDASWFWAAMKTSEALAAGHEDGEPLHPIFLPPVPGLTAKQRSATLIVGVFPMFFFALSPDIATWYRWLPTGPESHSLEIHILTQPSARAWPGYGEAVAHILEAVRGIQAEDAQACLGVQRGLRSRSAATGRLSDLERPLWLFQKYLGGRLSADAGDDRGGRTGLGATR